MLTTTVTLGEFCYRCHTNAVEQPQTDSSRYSGARAPSADQARSGRSAKSASSRSSAAASSSASSASPSASEPIDASSVEYLADKKLYQCAFVIGSHCWRRLVGRGAATLKQLQRDFSITMTVPKPDSPPDTPVYIRSADAANVASAVAHLRSGVLKQEPVSFVVGGAVELPARAARPAKQRDGPPTHFLSLPAQDAKTQQRLTAFLQRAVPILQQDVGVSGSSRFRPEMATDPARFHVTLLMLRLGTPEEETRAAQLLRELQPVIYDIVKTRSLLLRMQGVDVMDADPNNAHVLYVKVREDGDENRLLQLYTRLQDEFHRAGLLAGQPDSKPRFHATIFNDKIVAGPTKDSRPGFSAVALLNSPIRSFDFGIYRVPSLHLSIRGQYEASGYYKSLAHVTLP